MLLGLIVICLAVSVNTVAVPSYPYEVLLPLECGKGVVVTLKGDEYNKWALTTGN